MKQRSRQESINRSGDNGLPRANELFSPTNVDMVRRTEPLMGLERTTGERTWRTTCCLWAARRWHGFSLRTRIACDLQQTSESDEQRGQGQGQRGQAGRRCQCRVANRRPCSWSKHTRIAGLLHNYCSMESMTQHVMSQYVIQRSVRRCPCFV